MLSFSNGNNKGISQVEVSFLYDVRGFPKCLEFGVVIAVVLPSRHWRESIR